MGAAPGFPRVIHGTDLKVKLADLRRLARLDGVLAEVEAALEAIQEALLTRPLPPSDVPDTFGEPRFSIPPFTICLATIAPVVVYFGVTTQAINHHGQMVYPVVIRNLHLLT